jgi:hypothetical protein
MVDWEPVVIQLVILVGEDKAKDANQILFSAII